MPALTKRKIRMLSSVSLFFMALILQISEWAMAIFLAFNGAWIGVIMFGFFAAVLTVTLTVAALTGANDWAHIVTVTEKGILEGPFFCKRHFHPYSDYPLVYCTSYVHGMIGSPNFGPEKLFIVLTNQRLSDAEKNNINLVPSSRNLVKIGYTKRRYERLVEILPQNLKSQLAAVFMARIEPDNLALRRSAITSKARRRKKQKHHK